MMETVIFAVILVGMINLGSTLVGIKEKEIATLEHQLEQCEAGEIEPYQEPTE